MQTLQFLRFGSTCTLPQASRVYLTKNKEWLKLEDSDAQTFTLTLGITEEGLVSAARWVFPQTLS